ncbi:malto-oligosyltrehalose synthase [Oxyplasma meridianum]|uniref:Malto-oligosyltrehalose synthase n=1 Tax=Oxyplasma meridianum TaxID=3073602 RepID=A0AAX4NF95_9ARCH
MSENSEITSMYRIQFWKGFNFQDLKPVIPFLKKLGVDAIYSSPILKSTKGSTHGYDVTDFREVNADLGGEEGLLDITGMVHSNGIKWIQDTVPNHMAMNSENIYLKDVFKYGKKSFYWNLFDFMNTPEFHNRIDLFILGYPYEEVIKSGNICIVNPENPSIKIYDQEFPMSENSLKMLKSVTDGKITGEAIKKINSDPEMIHSFLSKQIFRVRYWKSGIEGTNYRRFFSVNSLIAIRTENTKYSGVTIQKLISLFRNGIIDGFRLDHIDGLFSPENFLLRFARGTENAPVWVEKILTGSENLRESWKTNGTTGYDFLYYCTYLFVENKGYKKLKEFYTLFSGVKKSARIMAYENKKSYIKKSFSHEADFLSYIFFDFFKDKIYGQDITYSQTREFMEELLSSFTTYRTYLTAGSKNMKDISIMRNAINLAGKRSGLRVVQESMNRMLDSHLIEGKALYCFQKLQQFIPATIAKSIEDRLFFQYNMLISLNEVGCMPEKFSISRKSFHRFMKMRSTHWPMAMNTLSTHDTKLGEDIRARIASISHMVDTWVEMVEKWHGINLNYKTVDGKKEYPTKNHEYYLYQILLAEDPDRWMEETGFRNRIHGQMVKMVREAGTISDWNSPDEVYEDHLSRFINGIMGSEGFRNSFKAFYGKAQFMGMLISISENIIKLTAPGIPDIYQGSEAMNLNFTDPDNRGNVDYKHSEYMLEKAVGMYLQGDYSGIKKSWKNGTLKIFINYIILNLRKNNPDIFLSGDYQEVETTGPCEIEILSYCRKKGSSVIIVTVMLEYEEKADDDMPTGMDRWGDTAINIPDGYSGFYRDIFTGNIYHGTSLKVGEMFSQFPFSVLMREAESSV